MRCLLKGLLLLVLVAVFLPMLATALAVLASLVAAVFGVIIAPLSVLGGWISVPVTAPLTLTYGMGVNLLAIVFLVLGIIGIAWLLKPAAPSGGSNSRFARQSDDEVRLMQDVHRNLSRMERRIEDLETIIIERERRRQR